MMSISLFALRPTISFETTHAENARLGGRNSDGILYRFKKETTHPHNLSLKVNFLFSRKLLADAIATAHSNDIAYCTPFSTNT